VGRAAYPPSRIGGRGSHLEALDEGAISGLDALLDLLIAPPTALVEGTESGSNSVGRSRFIELLTPFRRELVEEREFLHFEALPENVAALAVRIAESASAMLASAEDVDVLRGWGADDPLAVGAFAPRAVARGAELLGRLGYQLDPAALARRP
jgi:hypothetical protein